MQKPQRKLAGAVSAATIICSLPLLGFMLLFLWLMAAREAGQPHSGDGIGLAIMSVLAYGLAMLGFAIAAAYFGYQWLRHAAGPAAWHWLALGWSSVLLATPILYFVLNG